MFDSIDEGVDQFRLFREQAIFEINSASNQISGGIGDVNATLENLNDRLPKEVHNTLSFDVPYIIDAVAGEGITAGLCFMDAAAMKALFLLDLMKSELITGEPVPLPAPFICHASVSSINLNQDKNQRSILEFTGYNLSLNRQFTAYFVKADGDSIQVPVGRPTNYRIAANISNFSDNTIDDYQFLSLQYEGEPISSLFVVKKNVTPPTTKHASPRPKPSMIAAYPTSNSDDPYFYSDCRVSSTVQFGHNRNRAWVEITLIVEEIDDHNKTYAIGKSGRHYYYTAPSGWHIKKMLGQLSYDYHSYQDITNQEDTRITRFGQLTVDAKGSKAGSTTKGVLSFGSDVPDILLESGN